MRKSTVETAATGLGLLSILFWGSNIAVARGVSEKIGTLTSASIAFLVAGAIGLVPILLSRERRGHFLSLPPLYLLVCGGLFITYSISLYVAVGKSIDNQQVLEVSILNYLWPTLTLLVSIPILHLRWKPLLIPGLIAGFLGALVALNQGGQMDGPRLWQHVQQSWLPYVLGVTAAATWALYSVLTRRMVGDRPGNAIPAFLFLSGVALLVLRATRPEETHWTARAAGELAFMTLFPTLLAYLFWDVAMRRGRMVLVTAVSYFTPVLSLAISSVYLHTPAGWPLWIGCALVAIGAILCRLSLREPEDANAQDGLAGKTMTACD